MKRTIVDEAGDVRCPVCEARNQFVSKRTGKAKLVGVATVGVGVVAMPKRLKCSGCGTNLKRGVAPGRSVPPMSARTKAIVWVAVGVLVLVYLIAH